jgi:hypothetical protein
VTHATRKREKQRDDWATSDISLLAQVFAAIVLLLLVAA